MPYIPDLEFTGAEHRPAAPSVKAAMAPGAGLASLGEDIGEAGGDLRAIRRQKARDEAAVNEAQLEIQKARGDVEQHKRTQADPSTWRPYATTRVAEVKGKLADRPVSAEGRQRIDNTIQTAADTSGAEADIAAQQEEARQQRQVTSDLREKQMAHGDFAGARQTELAASGSIFNEAETQANLRDIELQESAWNTRKGIEENWRVIDDDPAKFLRENRADHVPPGMDRAVHLGNLARARERFAEEQRLTIHSIREGMTTRDGKPPRVNTEKDIDDLAPDAPDIVKNGLKQELLALHDARKKAQRATPEHERDVIGSVTAQLMAYQPDTDLFDEAYVAMDNQIRTLPPGGAQDELNRQLKARREGLPETDPGRRAMAEHYKAGGFGKVPDKKIMATADAVDAGFLEDSVKLRQIGYTEEHAMEIRNAKDNAERIKLFRKHWPNEGKAIKGLDPIVEKTATAIHKGTLSTDPDEEAAIQSARIQRELRYGQAMIDYAQWKASHPNAGSTEIEEKIIALSGQVARANAAQESYPKKPGF